MRRTGRIFKSGDAMVRTHLFEAASVLPVGGCIVTKLDETRRPATVLEAICEENLPVAFLSAGSDLARDLVRATPEVFADLFLRGRAS